jgi:hypothetical protein
MDIRVLIDAALTKSNILHCHSSSDNDNGRNFCVVHMNMWQSSATIRPEKPSRFYWVHTRGRRPPRPAALATSASPTSVNHLIAQVWYVLTQRLRIGIKVARRRVSHTHKVPISVVPRPVLIWQVACAQPKCVEALQTT